MVAVYRRPCLVFKYLAVAWGVPSTVVGLPGPTWLTPGGVQGCGGVSMAVYRNGGLNYYFAGGGML